MDTDRTEVLIDTLLAERRKDCYCVKFRKPCTNCDAYWEGLIDMADRLGDEPAT